LQREREREEEDREGAADQKVADLVFRRTSQERAGAAGKAKNLSPHITLPAAACCCSLPRASPPLSTAHSSHLRRAQDLSVNNDGVEK